MTATSTRPTQELRAAAGRHALAVADANWYTTENLFREVERAPVATLLLKCIDFRNALQRRRPPWDWMRPLARRGPALWERDLVLPSGWMKRFPRLGMRPIARAIRDWRRTEVGDGPLTLVMTYPHYLYLRDIVRPDRSVYFNVDDYALYWPNAAAEVTRLEHQAVRESDLTVCVSRLRADELRAAVPEATAKIHHLPHGFPTASLSEHAWERPAPTPADLAAIPRPILGYVGTLEDRLDWALLTRLSEAFPAASLVIVGRPAVQAEGDWYDDYQRCLSRPNVHALGWRPQTEIHRYIATFDVCLIPYKTDHPFNRACSPTKITDYMGTGRPIVATALPECRLYDHLFHVAETEAEFFGSVRSILDAGSDDGRASERFHWARAHTCRHAVERLLDWMPA